MGFFDSAPLDKPEPERVPVPVWAKPYGEFPAVIGDCYVLAQNDEAAIAVHGLTVYSTGFEFTVNALLRDDDRRGRIFGPGFRHPLRPDEAVPDEFLRVGVRFADGAAMTNLRGPGFPPSGEPVRGPLLVPNGASSDGRRYTAAFWVWPLPPPGPVTLVCEWPVMHLAESHVDIDAHAITEAAGRSTPIWPYGSEG
ncbi:hypothetical protein AB0H83_25310 [Dactylosporangium sp. NPDC050688]|uniref:hypothetical protein n=1 Tax=Dactylosporangium sp. NPDC050688 TaxID=3157217 RepID=UPI0033D520A9